MCYFWVTVQDSIGQSLHILYDEKFPVYIVRIKAFRTTKALIKQREIFHPEELRYFVSLLKISLPFMKPEYLLKCSQEPVTGSYPDTDKSSSHLHTRI